MSNFENNCAKYDRQWKTLDRALYALCRAHREHGSLAVINAKLWIIGRTYATGIERQIRSSGAQGSSLSQLAAHILANGRAIDDLMAKIAPLREPLKVENLPLILAAHGSLLGILGKITRDGLSPRSFVSKYLHFHHPIVPIYDNVAAAALRRLVPWTDALEVCSKQKEDDDEYRWYVLRFFRLYSDIRRRHPNATVKLVDHHVLS